ncbi:hypothetical protein [Paenibacillus silvisoli]|uniref:hypothetical protein n=1 Tax=Paenibacillus silvisoli TaxID=3110539 RepID=UPI0028049650|nr:hypothetical protein [Paenibacillus silvisoli]
MLENTKESAASTAEALVGSVSKGEMTINQARTKFGLEPIDEPAVIAALEWSIKQLNSNISTCKSFIGHYAPYEKLGTAFGTECRKRCESARKDIESFDLHIQAISGLLDVTK